MQADDTTTVTIDAVVRETGKTLCTVQLPETATISALKAAILEKRKSLITKALFLTTRGFTKDVINVIIDGQVVEPGP